MANVDRLYGVAHGGQIVEQGLFSSRNIGDVLVAPSRELMEDLLNLPKGTTVGIEYTPEIGTGLDVNGEHVDFAESSSFYWQRILRLGRKNNLNVEFLDNPDLYQKYLQQMADERRLSNKLDRKLSDKTHLETLRARHKAEVEAQFTFEIEREDAIIERILETNPTVAILGRVHADNIMQRLGKLKEKGVDIRLYRAELPDEETDPWSPLPYQRSFIDPWYQPSADTIIARTALERKHRAVTSGRITDGDFPAFIGTWTPLIPAEGLFEVFPQEEIGIVDVHGDAIFQGTITPDGSDFTKQYITAQSMPNVIPGNLRYFSGPEENGLFSGYIDAGRVRIPFQMARYSEGMDINKLFGPATFRPPVSIS